MEFKDLKQHMTHTNCFTRNTVSSAMAKMHGEPDHKQYDTEAGKLLRKAMESSEVRFIENRERSCYYDFAVHNALAQANAACGVSPGAMGSAAD